VWQVGDSTSNIIESLHADVNREGTFSTLVGAAKKGQHFDNMKLQSLHVSSHGFCKMLHLNILVFYSGVRDDGHPTFI
jgi:hypothetical protein